MENLTYKNFSVVIPAYNESSRIQRVLDEVLAISEASEVVVVDDGSTDDTENVLKKYQKDKRFCYFRHKTNKGKGIALKTGVRKVKNEVVLFLDADLRNITSQKILKIAMPVLRDEVDLSRGSFQRSRGRVTEFAVKPMMKVLFPDMYFDQPISGQICGKRSFLKSVDFESRYGVDFGILFDAIHAGQRIKEVNIGKLDHKANTKENIAEMSRQVLETMIQKAGLISHKYKLIVFTLDNTLIPRNSLVQIFKRLKIDQEAATLNDDLNFSTLARKIPRLLKGRTLDEIEKVCHDIPLSKYACEIINALKKRKYEVALISSNYSPIVLPIADRLGVKIVDCIYLNSKNGVITGEITSSSKERWLSSDLEDGFKKAFSRILRQTKTKASETIMVASSKKSIPLLKAAGMGIAYKPEDKELKEAADKTVSLHAEILILVE